MELQLEARIKNHPKSVFSAFTHCISPSHVPQHEEKPLFIWPNVVLLYSKGNSIWEIRVYYLLKAVELAVPPLRQRKEDVLPLARLFLAEAAVQMRKFVDGLTASAEEQLLGYSWPGNVCELANVLERAVALAKGNRVDVEDLPPEVRLVKP
jgi:transcriptional regulator of aromatic amino acid metabolism